MTEELIERENKPALPLWARIVLVLFSFLIATGIFQAVGMIITNVSFTDAVAMKDLSQEKMLFLQFSGLLATALTVFLFRKFIDKKSLVSMGFPIINRIIDIASGFLMALTVIGGGSLILIVLNYAEFSFAGINTASLLMSFLLFVIVAINEEVIMRGYILNNLMSSMNKYMALFISAVIFSLLHSLNFGISILPLINLVLAGLLLGSTYIFTQNLWFPISLHLFWNYFQGPVMGYSVSGEKIDSMLKINLMGSKTINGGEFGFEGSLICTIMLIISICLILFFYNRKALKEKNEYNYPR